MYYSARRRPDPEKRLTAIDVVCIVLVIAALVALVAWVIANAGGGHFVT